MQMKLISVKCWQADMSQADPALINIDHIVTVETYRDEHGDEGAFILLADGSGRRITESQDTFLARLQQLGAINV